MTTPGAQLADRPANRLARETSPYLLQHAHNPVDWFPWGEEAFAEARRRDVPIFLSIGYSTCYWCHVMERESFEDEATAAHLNQRMVSIKVDREERPDVDDIYMTTCQVFTQLVEGRASGGWPLSVFLDPATLKPFFAGTYFPPRAAFGRPSFVQLVTAISDAWRDRRAEVEAQAERLAELVARQLSAPAPPASVGAETARAAIDQLMRLHDREHGGFGGAPKFPQPGLLELLAAEGWHLPAVREAVVRTADAMASGGLFDQVGGGFHRYCVDATWTTPHFEKMLYDNAQLVSFYATLVSRTGDAFHRDVLRRTAEYVLREMTAPEGAFFSAQDAEVDAREGGSYVWSAEEVRAALAEAGREELWPFAESLYGLDRAPNFRDPHAPNLPPAYVLRLAGRPDALAAEHGLSLEQFEMQRAAVNAALKAARDRRPQPATDDKVIAAWNGLMIAGLAEAGAALNEDRFVRAAAAAARFILERLRTPDGGLRRVHRAGASRVHGFLEDYACVARGLLALHRADGNRRWLDAAKEIVEQAHRRFADPRGGFFDTLEGANDLFVRTRTVADGALPSGNSVMLHVLLDLHERTREDRWLESAAAALRGLSGAVAEQPLASALAVLAAARLARTHPEVLPKGDATRRPSGDDTELDAEVHISADPPELEVADESARFTVTITLPPGVHVYAHDPGHTDLVGLGLDLLDGEGLALEVAYQQGEPLDDGTLVHRGAVELRASLTRTGRVAGRPALILAMQPCTERECLPPVRRAVAMTIRA